jgi:hypothetical protein
MVTDFMCEQLIKTDREQEESIGAAVAADQFDADDHARSTSQTEVSNEKENLIVELVDNTDDPEGRKNWAINSRFDMRFRLMPGIKIPIGEQIKMRLLLHSIHNQDIQYQKMVALDFDKDRTAYLRGVHQVEQEGIYRINVLSAERNKKLFGSTAFNAFKAF